MKVLAYRMAILHSLHRAHQERQRADIGFDVKAHSELWVGVDQSTNKLTRVVYQSARGIDILLKFGAVIRIVWPRDIDH